MSRRLELLTYGLVACLQVLIAWLVFSHYSGHIAPPQPPVVAHMSTPAAPGGAQTSKRHF